MPPTNTDTTTGAANTQGSSTPSAPRSPGSTPKPRRRVWQDSQVAALTEGTLPDERIQELLRANDSRGMNPATFATLRTAKQTGDLLALLALLDPPQKQEQSQLDQVIQLLEKIAEAQVRIERRMAAVESRLAGPNGDSPPPRGAGRTVSQH